MRALETTFSKELYYAPLTHHPVAHMRLFESRVVAATLLIGASLASGCASNTTSPTQPSGSTTDVDPPATSATPTAPAKTNEPVATDHEFTPNDCEEMGRKYRDLHASDLRKTMKPGLSPEQVQQAETTIAEAAKTLAGTWTDACRKNNVGTFAPQESLDCAMHATTVNGFDGCLNAAPAAAPSASAKQSAPPPAKR